jgi:hypothetical protein
MPSVQGSRIVMINVAVNDLERSRRFYEELLNVEFAEERHGDGPLHLNTTFGEWNTPSWFLLALWPDSDRAGTVDIGFLVDDLDQAYERPRGRRNRRPRSTRDSRNAANRAAQRPKREPHRPLPSLISGGPNVGHALSLGTVPAYSASRIPNGASSFR